MRVYKVVRREDGKLVSFMASGKALVEYRLGEWVSAPKWLEERGYYLTAFEDLSSAMTFIMPMNFIMPWRENKEIWECECQGISRKLPIRRFGEELETGEFWIHSHKYYASGDGEWPTGTVMCKKLKLIRKVWPDGV